MYFLNRVYTSLLELLTARLKTSVFVEDLTSLLESAKYCPRILIILVFYFKKLIGWILVREHIFYIVYTTNDLTCICFINNIVLLIDNLIR
jgi:hypothetical protein